MSLQKRLLGLQKAKKGVNLATLMEKDILLEASAELIAKTYKNNNLYQDEAVGLWNEIFYTEFKELEYFKKLNMIKHLSYKLSVEEEELSNDEIFSRIVNTELNLKNPNLTTQTSPKGYVIGGQPGSGKALLLRKIAMMNDKNIAVINADEYRKYHPKYYSFLKIYGKEASKFTSEFATKMTEAIISEVIKRKFNVVVEGNFKNFKNSLKTIKLLKDSGYETSAYIVTTDPAISYASCMERYEKALKDDPKNARFVSKEYHDLVFENLNLNLNKIENREYIDELKVFKRSEDGKIL